MRSCVLFLLLAGGWSCSKALDVGHPDVEGSKNLRMLEFVMCNDAGWEPVLGRKIKIENRPPPYHGHETDAEVRRKLNLFDDRVTEISPLTVIGRVLNDFRWLGSYVDYAADVLRTAFACFTHSNVSRLLELIASVEHGNREPESESGDDPFRDAWSALLVFVDKMAAIKGNLDAIADLSYAYADVMLSSGKRDARLGVVRLMREEIDRVVNDRCYGTTAAETAREYLNWIFENSDQPPNSVENFRKVIDRLSAVYDELNVETMPMDSWRQAFNFKIPLDNNVKFRLNIDEVIQDDPLGREVIEDTALRVKTFRETYAIARGAKIN